MLSANDSSWEQLADFPSVAELEPSTSTATFGIFDVTVTVERQSPLFVKVSIGVAPFDEQSGYAQLVGVRFLVQDRTIDIDADLWKGADPTALKWRLCASRDARILVQARAGELMSASPFDKPSPHRALNITCDPDASWWIDPKRLLPLGGTLFTQWNEQLAQSRDRLESVRIHVEDIDLGELSILLDACAAYTQPVVHRKNWHTLLELGERFESAGLLRLTERFLCDSRSIHIVRLLEVAVEFRLGLLWEAARARLNVMGRQEALRQLHDYLRANDESLEDMHPRLVALFGFASDAVIVG